MGLGLQDGGRRWPSASRWTGACTAYGEIVGPRGATLANLLSHSSGLGLEEGDPVVPVATKRVYSNYGYDHAVARRRRARVRRRSG